MTAYQTYVTLKQQHPDAILLMRIGDFYEAFDADANTFAQVCGISLTKCQGRPIAGVPYHVLDYYTRKLIAAGYRVETHDNS